MPPIAFENLVKASEEKRREEDYFAPDPVDCRIRSRDVPVEKGLYHIPHCGNAAWVYVPKCRLNEEDYFHTYESSRWMHGLDYDDPRFLRGYLDSLDHDNLRRAASIEESADGSITINPGLRRYPKPSERKVAEGIYYLGFVPSKHWSCDHPKPDFYNELVAPHVMGRKAPTPVEWITMRLQYAHGHGSEMCGRDYSPGQIEHSYRFMAELVCNPMPEALIPERKYTLSESGKHLFSRLTALCDPSALPEAAVFVLENEALFSLETLEHPDFKGFLEKLPIALENGLVIDRVSELVQDLVRRGIDTTEAVLHSARLTAGIYGGEEKPWWFKEDFRLRPSRGGTSNISAATLRREERLAELSGFAYMYARSVYYRAGRKLRAFEGTSEEDVLKFTSSVASSYGIGNLPRAESVIEFAVELLKDTAPDQRPEALARFAATAIRVAPSSPAMGALEGTETVISTPGLPAFLWTHLGEDAKADEMTVRPHHLRLLGGRLETLSLPERAKLPLPLNIPPSDTPLLTEHVPLDVLALPPVRNEITAQNAIMGWLEFDQQLFDECGEGGRDIAPVYWTFCANKMPDPMRPPPGFLRLIQKFYYIPEPRIDLIDIWSPFADHSLAKRNAQIRVDRWALLSSLLDASILGLIPFERVQQTLQEITFEFEAEKEAQRQKVRDENPGKDDECLVQDLYHATEELQGKENRIQVARLRGLEGVSRVMSLMTTAGLLPGAQVDFGEGLDSFVENAAKRPGFARPLFQLLERESGSLKQLAALGIISVPELIHFLNEAPRESLRSGARKLKVLADAVQEANKLTADRFWSAEVTGGSITEALVSIRNIQLKTVKRLQEAAGGLSFVNMRPIPSYVGSLFPGAYQAAAIPAVKSIIEDYGDNQQLHTAVDSARQSARLVISSWGMMKITEMWNDIAQRGPEDPSFAVETAIQDEPAPETSTAIVPLSPYHKAMEDAVAAVKQKLPAIEKMIADKRRETFGLYPLGAKIHVLHTVDEEMLKRLEKILSYERGCFGLQHSNHTLVLPPMPSSAEMEWVVGFLDFHRVLDKVYPEIQICLPGRLKPESCAYLGATVLLATKEGTKYKEDSFATKDDSYTGFRIMVYDKGGRRLPFPFEPETLGRTDMLGRRDLKDFDIYQLVGTVLVQDEARQKSPAAAPFAHLAGEYRARFREILGRYGIASVLDASWILVPGEKFDAKDGISHYRDAICPCVNAWFNDYAAYKQGKRASGAVYETRRLVDWLRDQVNIVQGKMLAGSGYDRQKELLFRMGGRSYVL